MPGSRTIRSIGLGLCACLFSLLLGIGLAHAIEPSPALSISVKQSTEQSTEQSLEQSLEQSTAAASASPYGMVDPVDARYEAGYRTYLNNCATCHVALPAAVLPIPTWQTLITETAHYGVTLPAMLPFEQQLALNYLQTYSRQHQSRGPVPYRLKDSDYFQALHPGVDFPQPVDIRSCASCHIGASQQDYTLPVRTVDP